jgi:cytochrome P450
MTDSKMLIAPLRRAFDSLAALSEFSKDPYIAMDRLYERNGPVSWLGAGPVRFALLLGPEANQFVLANTDRFSWERAFAGLVPLAGSGALLVNDGERHRRLRSLVQPAFTMRKVAGHVSTVQRHVGTVVNEWAVGDVIDVYGAFRAALRDATIESLFGASALQRAHDLRDHLQTIHEAIDTSPLVRKVQRLGLPSWKRAVAARAAVRHWVVEEISRRRSDGSDAGPDVLATLLASRADDVPPLTEDEICDQLISLLEAGAETTSATFAWALYGALSDRGIWDAVVAEVAGMSPDGASAPADVLTRTGYLDRVVSETLRLYPATVVASRMVATECSFAGHRFPPGVKLVFSPYHTHRLPQLWPDATRFAPWRWDPSRPEYRKPETYEFLPFGGGSHRCVGAEFAKVAVKAALAQVARDADPWLVSKNAQPTGLIGMRPRHGLTLLVRETRQTRKVQR